MPIIVERGACPLRGLSLPDYAAPKTIGTVPVGSVYTSTDIAELAARLGSIVTFDRRGNVAWMDNFEDGIQAWESTFYQSLSWDPINAARGGFSLATEYANSDRDITHNLPLLPLGKNGLEVSYAFGADTKTYMPFSLSFYDGAAMLQGAVRYSENDHTLEILNSTGGYTLVASDVQGGRAGIFAVIKLVIDFATKKYERLIFNGVEYDLSAHSIYEAASVAAPHVTITLKPVTTSGFLWTAWYDAIILTQNEPANT